MFEQLILFYKEIGHIIAYDCPNFFQHFLLIIVLDTPFYLFLPPD